MKRKPTYEALEERVRELEKSIPELKRAKKDLRHSEELLQLVMDNIPQAIFWKDKNSIYTGCNTNFARHAGVASPAEIVGKSDYDLAWRKEETEAFLECDRRVMTTGQAEYHIIEPQLQADGKQAWLETNKVPLFDTEGKVVGILGTYEDISERKKAEEALRLNEEKYRTLFDESRDAVYITSREGTFLDGNRAALDLFGYSREEMIGKLNVREIYSNPDDRAAFQKRIESTGSVRDYPLKFKKKNGEGMDCLLTATVRRSSEREIIGYQGIIRDVTEYKRAEKALRESEARYRAIVEAFDGLIYICSKDYYVEFMNRRFIERTGYDGTGQQCYKVLHDLDGICPWCVNERVFEGETVRWEMQSPKDNCWYYIVNTPIYHEDGTVSKQAMILDITKRKRMEEALRKTSEKIKLFAYSVSHDLKSPAVAVYGLTKLLLEHYGKILDEKGKQYCEQICSASEQIAALVEKINVYISTKEVPLNIEEVRLKEVLQMVKDEFSTRFNIRRIEWMEPEYLPAIKADRLSVLRMFRNLIDNALKYAGESLSKIEIGYEQSDEFHVLSVKDDGIGIRKEDSEKIFGLFERKKTSAGIEGAGLGLAIVKEIAEQHKGKVWVVPGSEKGTTFSISVSKRL